MKQGSKNILLIGGAGIALYILMKGDLSSGGPSDIFGGKEEKGTVASAWTGGGGDSGGGSAIQEQAVTKKEAASIPAGFNEPRNQQSIDFIAQSQNALNPVQELGLIPGTYKDLGQGYYGGVRVLPTGQKKVVQGSTSSVGYAIDTQTGQKYTDLGGGVRLYTEASRDLTPYENLSAKRGVNYIQGASTPAVTKKTSSSAGGLTVGKSYGGFGMTYRGTNSSGGRVFA